VTTTAAAPALSAAPEANTKGSILRASCHTGTHGPHTVGWWRRRQALETAVHRWDAEAATGDPSPVPTGLAVDGIDEYLFDFLPRIYARRPAGSGPGELPHSGTLHLHATDAEDIPGGGEWFVEFEGDYPSVRREHAKADTALRGPASGLYLWLWNRQTPAGAGLEVLGSAGVVGAWANIKI